MFVLFDILSISIALSQIVLNLYAYVVLGVLKMIDNKTYMVFSEVLICVKMSLFCYLMRLRF